MVSFFSSLRVIFKRLGFNQKCFTKHSFVRNLYCVLFIKTLKFSECIWVTLFSYLGLYNVYGKVSQSDQWAYTQYKRIRVHFEYCTHRNLSGCHPFLAFIPALTKWGGIYNIRFVILCIHVCVHTSI